MMRVERAVSCSLALVLALACGGGARESTSPPPSSGTTSGSGSISGSTSGSTSGSGEPTASTSTSGEPASTEPEASSQADPRPSPPPPSATTSAPDPTAPAVPDSFGVLACDRYAALSCACSNTSLRADLCASVHASFSTWASVVRNYPTARDAIATGCTGSEQAMRSACPDTVVTVDAAATEAAAATLDALRDAPMPGTWDGHTPYSCSSGSVLLSGITASLPGETAIYTAGSCHLTLTDMHVSGQIAIEAGGDSVVTITRGTYAGTRSALYVGGNAHVSVNGATLTGGVEQGGNAVVTGVP